MTVTIYRLCVDGDMETWHSAHNSTQRLNGKFYSVKMQPDHTVLTWC